MTRCAAWTTPSTGCSDVRIFHIATATDWAAAQASGSYTTSTRGVSVLDEGFIHASREDQWEGVRDRLARASHR